MPSPGAKQKYAALRKAEDLAAACGLTSVQNAGFNLEDLPVYERLLAENGVKTRFYSALMMVKNPFARARGTLQKAGVGTPRSALPLRHP